MIHYQMTIFYYYFAHSKTSTLNLLAQSVDRKFDDLYHLTIAEVRIHSFLVFLIQV